MQEEKQKILLIEDDVALQHILQTKLNQAGYEVSLAEDGNEGFKKAKKEKPDLILLDIVMPHMNGVDVLRNIRNNNTTQNIKVVVLTNSGKESERKEIIELGVEDYLVKSRLSLTDIGKMIEDILRK